MDERTLNDLLECSVCLERLDTSSKVLPCQHTFCRKCLEVIVSSRQELRCPECRVLVDIRIEDLPPNVLLMRILEGMKNAYVQNQNNSTNSPRTLVNNSNPVTTVAAIPVSSGDTNDSAKPHPYQQQIRAFTETVTFTRVVPHGYALHDFVSTKTGDLNFKKGDIILFKRKLDINWFVGELNGREGAVPINYVQIVVPLPIPQCIALYDFKMGPNEEEGCLTFKKHTIINVLRRVDHNWAEGCIGSHIGIFPIAFVEMNALARELLNSTTYITPRCLPHIPFEVEPSDSSTSVTTSPNSTCSSNTSSNSVPSSPTNTNSPRNTAAIGQRDLKEKRHSLNALSSNTSLSIVQSNRHSAEILSVPEPSDTNSTNAPEVNPEESGNTSNTTTQESPSSQQTQQSQSQQSQGQQSFRANVLKTNINQNVPHLPWAYVALYPYKPRKSDELELKKGCVYFVTERCLDGWYKGRNWADKTGVFPGNYVTPLRNRDQQQVIHQKKASHNKPYTHQIMSQSPSQNQQEQVGNSSLQSLPPPELPPRTNTVTSASVWTKPLGHHVESFLNKKFSNTPRNENTAPKCGNINHIIKNSSSSQPSGQHPVIKDKDKKEPSSSSAVGLMKRLTNIKRSKSPPNQNLQTYSMDNPVFEDTIVTTQVNTSAKHTASLAHPVHVRSGSCPSQLLQSLPVVEVGGGVTSTSATADPFSAYGSQRLKGHKERTPLQGIRQPMDVNRTRKQGESPSSNVGSNSVTCNSSSAANTPRVQQSQQPQKGSMSERSVLHRKSQSLDANTISSHITNSSLNAKSYGVSHTRDSRFRCIVSYPPNSDVELELNVGDIVFVHRKQKNGWYKGTHARTNQTGLFPASFVEPDI